MEISALLLWRSLKSTGIKVHKITHTVFMKKFLVFCLSAFFLFSNCQKNDSVTPAPIPDPLPLPKPNLPMDTPSTNAAPVENEFWDTSDIQIDYIQENRKLVAFTFDDAPTLYLENLLAIFAEFNEQNPDCKATATVFCNGVHLDENTAQILHASLALGFELGNHTYSHFNLNTLKESELLKEIDTTDELLKKIDGKSRHLFRAPYGNVNTLVKKTVLSPIIDWSIDTLDWKKTPDSEICQTVKNQLFDGAIVLMHDGYINTLSAMKRLLPELKEMGYQAVSVSALAKAHSLQLKKGSRYIRLRKQK